MKDEVPQATPVPSDRTIRLPPMNALRAFHATYQCQSLTKASEVLMVTPQAIGQQIKVLEKSLGVQLFVRSGRELQATPHAVLLARFVLAGMREFSDGVAAIKEATGRAPISVIVSPFFAKYFLMPMMHRLTGDAAPTEIRLSTSVVLPDFDRKAIDVAIHWGYGDWDGVEATLLRPDPKVICCAPELAQSLRLPSDLKAMNLLNLVRSSRLWPAIFRHLGLDGPPECEWISFDDASTMRAATRQGLGVGLLSEMHADDDIRERRLVAPWGRHVLDDMAPTEVPGFYLVVPKSRRRVPQVENFCNWLLRQDWRAMLKANAAAPT